MQRERWVRRRQIRQCAYNVTNPGRALRGLWATTSRLASATHDQQSSRTSSRLCRSYQQLILAAKFEPRELSSRELFGAADGARKEEV